MKVLITGNKAIGKSTIAAELQRRGITSIDGDDEPGFVRLEDKETGKPVEWPKGYVDWSYYAWNLQQPKLSEILERDDTVFLAGIYSNQSTYYSLFDKLIVLTLSPEEYRRRLHNRPRREVGDDEANVRNRIVKYPLHLQRFLDAGAIPIDAAGTVAETVDAILKVLGNV